MISRQKFQTSTPKKMFRCEIAIKPSGEIGKVDEETTIKKLEELNRALGPLFAHLAKGDGFVPFLKSTDGYYRAVCTDPSQVEAVRNTVGQHGFIQRMNPGYSLAGMKFNPEKLFRLAAKM